VTTEPLPADLSRALEAAAARLGPFGALQCHAEVESTNDIALALAARGAPEGASVLADSQRGGRGRRGRSWHSPPGAGVYLSVVLRPPPAGAALSLVTLQAGVSAARAVQRATGLTPEIKWPNDLVVGRPWRKLGGVLAESTGAGDRVEAVIVGIGINLHQAAFPPEVASRATSLEVELGRAPDRPALVVELLADLAAATPHLWRGERTATCQAWRRLAQAGLGGAPVRWRDEGGDRRGKAVDIDEDGGLIVDRDEASGAPQRVRLVAGEVSWDRLSA
jgi:BirA family biotin operon repressor/biotin-[acetyl-CoA-carboxylase] ligase